MRIAIVEDMPADRELLAELLGEYLKERDIEHHMTMFANGEDFLRVAVKDTYDICFFDIFMGGQNGMETARRFVEEDKECCIFFLTSSPDFMAEGYDVRAWRYLLKPITHEKLAKAMPSCLEKIVLNRRRLHVLINRRPCSIPFSQIQYIITAERRTIVRTLHDTLNLGTQTAFSELTAPLLDDFRFLSIGKGQVVNLMQVREIADGAVRLRCGDKLLISRRHLTSVSERFIDFRLNNP